MRTRALTPLVIVLCYWFMQAQAVAVTAGVPWPASSFSTAGTYSGVMVPDSVSVDTSDGNFGRVNPEDFLNTSALVVFTVGIPNAGFQAGSLLAFINGVGFVGTLQVTPNDQAGQIIGVMDADATLNQILGQGDNQVTSVPQFAGQIIADLVNSTTNTTSSLNLVGVAGIQIVGDIFGELPDALNFSVFGFKQSDDPSAGGDIEEIDTGGTN